MTVSPNQIIIIIIIIILNFVGLKMGHHFAWALSCGPSRAIVAPLKICKSLVSCILFGRWDLLLSKNAASLILLMFQLIIHFTQFSL